MKLKKHSVTKIVLTVVQNTFGNKIPIMLSYGIHNLKKIKSPGNKCFSWPSNFVSKGGRLAAILEASGVLVSQFIY